MKLLMRAGSPAPKSSAVCSGDACESPLVNIEHHSGKLESTDYIAQSIGGNHWFLVRRRSYGQRSVSPKIAPD